MISGEYYNTIYLFLVSIIKFIYVYKYKNSGYLQYESIILFFLSVLITLFIGFRPLHRVFVDMNNYNLAYIKNIGLPFDFNWNSENFLFDNWFLFCASNHLDKSVFFVSIAAVYFVGAAIASFKLFRFHSVIGYLFFLGAFSAFSYGTNGIKAGAAMSVFLMAVAWWQNKKIAMLLLWISLGLHHSMLMPIGAFILCYFVRKPKLFFYCWLICLILSATHVTSFMNVVSDIIAGSDQRTANYFTEGDEWGGKSGFRYDFVIYSFMPILVGYYVIFKRKINDSTYNFLWSLYCIINSFWLVCMYAQFTNRIAYLSWGMYPFVLCYPFLMIYFDERQYNWVGNIALLHLGFTLFMNIIYY